MWTLQTHNGDKFLISENQLQAYLKVSESGAKLIKIGGLYISPSSVSLIISDEEMKLSKLRQNPILNDPDFKKWVESGNPAIANHLDKRYYLPKFQKEWDEAKSNKKYLDSLTI